MKKKIVIFISAIALLTSCDNMLDVKPLNTINAEAAVSTSKDVEALLVGAYTFLGDGDVYGGNLQRDAELIAEPNPFGAPPTEVFWDGTFVDPGQIFTKEILTTNGQVENTYLDSYRVINICNTVLANLAVVTADKVDRVEGEAKFIRGSVYFELARVFGRTWTDTNGTPATNPAVPLVLEPNVTGKVNRNTVAEVYAQVLSDLLDAEALLPTENGFFATTYSASAMLSRVYLMQNNYALARDAANTVIQSGEYDLLASYADNFNNSSNGSTNASIEDVFSIQVTTQAGINNMNTFFATSDYAGRGDIYVEPGHFALYNPADDRLNLFYDGERTGKWNNQFGNVNIIRLSEMYLTRAEANLRVGTNVGDTPLNDVNLVRNRVGLTPLGAVTIAQVLAERHLELAFEGSWIHDLKRTQSNVGALPFNADELVYPIPKREIFINPDMGQNPGYN